MKRSSKNFLAVVLAAGSLAMAGQVQATPGKLDNLNFITVACKLQLQGDFVDDGSLRNYANPTIARLGTKELLAVLATDK